MQKPEIKAHIEGRVIHVYPEGAFGEREVNLYEAQIEKLIPKDTTWALFEHPKLIAGLSPDGQKALLPVYMRLISRGCVVIASEVSSIFIPLLHDNIFPKLGCPCLASQHEGELANFIKAHL